MFGQNRTPRRPEEAAEPLLSRTDDSNNEVVFALDDSDGELDSPKDENTGPNGHVRFQRAPQDEARGLPLRSTIGSRETEFEQDSDDLDENQAASIEQQTRTRRDQTMPLLVGLMDSAHSPHNPDGSIPLRHGQDGEGDEFDLEELAAKRIAGGNLIDSIANMANSILGAGIIGLPYAVSQAGFFTGIILLVTLCAITDWTIRLIVINAKMSGRHTYIDIMDHCFGASGRAAVSFFQFAFAFGGMCAFGIIMQVPSFHSAEMSVDNSFIIVEVIQRVAFRPLQPLAKTLLPDTIPHVVRSIFPKLHETPVLWLFTNRKFIIALCTICVSYPLSLYRDIHKLSRASGLALVGMIVIVTSVLIEAPQANLELKGDPSKRLTILGPGVFSAIGVISFAFVCHHNSLLIYGSLRTPTLDRFATVTHISTALSLVACCTLALSAFWVFTDKTQGNILNNFDRVSWGWFISFIMLVLTRRVENDTLINVARFCFGLNMFTTLPLELFVCREVVEHYFFSHEAFSQERHIAFTSGILFSAMCISLITCDLGVMLEITGGISATALAFIFPAACYLKLSDSQTHWYSRQRLPAIACVAFGCLVMITSLFLTMGKAWNPEEGPRICA